ncbi:AAA family ATPase, partial [Spirulina sp. 06S082]
MTPKFKDLQIQGFRGFQDIELSNLGQVNLIVGTNNSGKTSLLEAISIFCNPLNPFRWLEVSKRRFFFNSISSLRPNIESIKWIFYKQEKRENLETENHFGAMTIQADGDMPIKKLEVEILELYGSAAVHSNEDTESYREGLELEIKVQERYPLFNINTDELEFYNSEKFQFWEDERFVYRKRRDALINNVTISPSYSYSETVRFTESIIKNENSKNEILNLIRLFDPCIKDIMILSPKKSSSILYLDHEKLGRIPLDVFGDGIKRTLAIALALQAATN